MSEPQTAQEKHLAYQRSLSRVVGEACDKFFERKGITKNKSWKEQNDLHFKKGKRKWLTINDLRGGVCRAAVTRWCSTSYEAKVCTPFRACQEKNDTKKK